MKKVTFILGMLVLPHLASAQDLTYLNTVANQGRGLLGNLLIFLVSLAVVWFIWNVIRYTMSSEEDKKSEAKSQMIWGIIAIVVIVSVWGIVGQLRKIFGVQSGGVPGLENMIPGGAVAPAPGTQAAGPSYQGPNPMNSTQPTLVQPVM